MEKASGVCVSMTPKWDFKVHEAAQNSFRHAYHLLSCISGQNYKASIQEVSLIAQNAENEFRKLVTLLDVGGSISSDYRRIRKGPLPDSHDINLVELMDSPNSLPHGFSCNPTQNNKSATALIRSDSLSLCGVKLFSQQPSTSLISMEGSGVVLGSRNESFMLSSKNRCGVKSASTSGCHCSKRR